MTLWTPTATTVWLAFLSCSVWVLVSLETTYYGYLFGIFSFFLCFADFLTHQFHKWAHMDVPPAIVGWLQAWGVILSKEHHDIHITRAPLTPTTA